MSEGRSATIRTLDDGLRGMRLWVLDDNVILDGIRALLGGWGCETILASSLEALESVLTTSGTRAADALLVDYRSAVALLPKEEGD